MKLIYLLLLPVVTMAQQPVPPQPAAQSLGRPWTVAFSLVGWQGLGPGGAIVQTMKETGWASIEPRECIYGFCVGPTDFPSVRKNVRFDLDVGRRLSVRHGYQISVGLPVTAEITGHSYGGRRNLLPFSGTGAYLYLHSRIYYASFRWAWFSANGRLVGSAGPALLLVQDFEKFGPTAGPRHSQLRPGLHLSGQYRLINKRTWLLAAKVDARLGSPVSTSTYQRETDLYSPQTPTGPLGVSPFSAKDIPTSHLHVGLQLGFKFR
jgi:hypothetical protein